MLAQGRGENLLTWAPSYKESEAGGQEGSCKRGSLAWGLCNLAGYRECSQGGVPVQGGSPREIKRALFWGEPSEVLGPKWERLPEWWKFGGAAYEGFRPG